MTEIHAARPLPMRIEEIDAAWLTRALRIRAPGVTVRGVEVVDVNNGTSTKIRLRLDMDEAGKAAGIPELVMLKGGFETHSREMDHIHHAEARGYRDVLPFLGLRTPVCYFADYEDELRQGIVIMEDLVARGVEFCSALKPQTFDQVAWRLSDLARFHAQTWDTPEFKPGGRWNFMWNPSLGPFRGYLHQYLGYPEVWKRFVDSPRGAAVSAHFQDLTWVNRAFDQLVNYTDRLPRCIVHGDTHLGNLYIDPDGAPGFFDSMTGCAPGMQEVTYHLTCAVDTGDRRRWEGALIQHYLTELKAHGADAPTFDQAMEQFAACLHHGFVIFMINESFYQPEAVNTAYTARFSAAMLDHDTKGLLAKFD